MPRGKMSQLTIAYTNALFWYIISLSSASKLQMKFVFTLLVKRHHSEGNLTRKNTLEDFFYLFHVKLNGIIDKNSQIKMTQSRVSNGRSVNLKHVMSRAILI